MSVTSLEFDSCYSFIDVFELLVFFKFRQKVHYPQTKLLVYLTNVTIKLLYRTTNNSQIQIWEYFSIQKQKILKLGPFHKSKTFKY